MHTHTFTYACAEVKIPHKHKHRSQIILFFSLIIFDYNAIKCQSFISQTDQSKWFTYERQASIVRINREIHTNMSESLLNIVISLICIKATTQKNDENIRKSHLWYVLIQIDWSDYGCIFTKLVNNRFELRQFYKMREKKTSTVAKKWNLMELKKTK